MRQVEVEEERRRAGAAAWEEAPAAVQIVAPEGFEWGEMF